jgi:hypothetical protein
MVTHIDFGMFGMSYGYMHRPQHGLKVSGSYVLASSCLKSVVFQNVGFSMAGKY